MIVYVENSDGNTNVRFYQAETHKTIALAFPFLNKNGIEFKLDAVDFLRLPSPQ